MDRNARALKRSAEHFKGILHNVREDLLREKGLAEDEFVKSLDGEGHGGVNHIAEFDPPDRAAERRSIDLSHRIQRIDAAMGRIDRGTFGICFKKEDCVGTGKIDHFLLVNDPTRLYCQECQKEEDERNERQKRMMRCRGTIPGRR